MIRRMLLHVAAAAVLTIGAALLMTSASGCASVTRGDYNAARVDRAQNEAMAPVALPSAPIPPAPAVASERPDQAANGFALIPLPADELWIISKPSEPQPTTSHAELDPGSGALVAQDPATQKLISMPLKHTDVKASIAGILSTVDVIQQFSNPFERTVEAVYVFPLPQDAAVNEFVMTIGDRRIRGIIRERQEAQQLYNEACAQGYVASLLTQERPNIFTQKVANIEPGKQIDVSIRYFNTLVYRDGWYEFVFPMVVRPRFNPASIIGEISAVRADNQIASGQRTDVPYLSPAQRSGNDISLSVSIDAGVAIEEIQSTTHLIKTSPGHTVRNSVVDLAASDSIPNKDFVLRYRVAGKEVRTGVAVHRDAKRDAGYFALMLFPPAELNDLPRASVEMFFALDVSTRMSGQPLAQSKAALRYALTHLRTDDTFQIVLFAADTRTMAARPLPATAENIRTALRFMDSTASGGGAMILPGIRACLDAPPDERRLRYVTFFTDGYIGNEADILSAIHQSLGGAHVFCFGVGSATNRYLLDHMAKIGNGAVAYLGPNDNAERIMADYCNRISHPALTHVTIDWSGMDVSECLPKIIPDLFVGRPLMLMGKFQGTGTRAIRVSGSAAGQVKQFDMQLNLDDPANTHPALPAVWARSKIVELAEQSTYGATPELPQQLKRIALDYGLLSSFTAFVTVDSLSKTVGGPGTTVAIPVPVPDDGRNQTAVSGPSIPRP